MADYIKVTVASSIPTGSMKSFIVQGKKVAIANVAGEFFAIDDSCTHAHCSLGDEGFFDAHVVTCGCHGAQFDIASGKVLALPATQDLTTYPVRTHGEEIFVKI